MAESIVVDVGKVTGMFERLQHNADELGPVVERAAAKMLASVSGIPVKSGTLASSLHVKRVSSETVAIVSSAPYAIPVFYGHKDRGGGWVEGIPPRFAYGKDQFLADIAQGAFR